MSRPTKCRRVGSVPEVNYFKPAGIPLTLLDETYISVEELEAVRLKDLEGLEQEQCAEKMNVSRPTFQRVLGAARQKIADALLNGKVIRIEGGNFELATRRYRCLVGHEWDVPLEAMAGSPPESCPKCDNPNIFPIQPPAFDCSTRGPNRQQRRRQGRQTLR
jgi:predicted DNA-binding protein (UPF0251 family)